MKTLIVSSIITLASLSAFAGKTIPAGTYSIDPAHTKIGFEVPHLVIATVEGRFAKFDGSLIIDSKLEKSKASVNIDVASISTENKDRDDHLKSADFFDVAKNPKMTFVTKKVVGSAENLKIIGDLTLKGKTKEVSLDVKYLGEVNDAYGNNKVAFNATGKINRKEFGLNWSSAVEAGPVVGDEVTLILKIQAAKPAAKKG